QNLTNGDATNDQTTTVPVSATPSSQPPPVAEDKFLVSVEVCLKPSSTARTEDVRLAVERMLEKRNLSYVDGPIDLPLDDTFLVDNVQRICICDTEEWVANHDILLFWQVKPLVHVYQLSEEGPIVLLHGPPGTGKTSLCKALAQKLSIRFSSRYPHCQLIEVNAHSLFSKWFSESGKLVAKLFQKIQEMVEEENNLVFVLIDEVESLAAARKAAISGSEPSDSIRVVNALLTQMDKLKSSPNVIILTTSNITAAIDIAFVDRADIKAYVGPPTLQARYEILRSCLQELLRTGILSSCQDGNSLILPNYASLIGNLASATAEDSQSHLNIHKHLLEAAQACEGLSGRSLRKLPFLAHAALAHIQCQDPTKFLLTMINTINRERSEIPD
ncbi:hypothetical protein M8C21_018796, partial [Ambrosia artemisiifolia]